MDLEEVKTLIEQCELDGNKVCIKNSLYDIVNILKNKYSYNMLKSITAVDLGEEVELIYNLYSVIDEEEVILSVKVKNEAESIIDLFDSAKADENEIYDKFGIRFIGNEDLKRLYMPENWTGFPLRKDYVQDDTRLVWNDNSNNA